MVTRRSIVTGGLLGVFSLPAAAQFASLRTTLKPRTVTEFQAYAQKVEAELNARWSGKSSFLQIDDIPEARKKVRNGDLWVHAESQSNPHLISDGLIHDWYGAILIPNTTLPKVLNVLEDFDHHAEIYPKVTKSRIIRRNGNDVTGYWRLEEKGQIWPAVFDVTLTTHFQEVSADKWYGISHADDIQCVDKATTLPPGEGFGFMWKLYSYWTLQREGTGVVAECRSISLSRGIPGSVAWLIRPLLNSIPKESMDSTLRSTRKALGE